MLLCDREISDPQIILYVRCFFFGTVTGRYLAKIDISEQYEKCPFAFYYPTINLTTAIFFTVTYITSSLCCGVIWDPKSEKLKLNRKSKKHNLLPWEFMCKKSREENGRNSILRWHDEKQWNILFSWATVSTRLVLLQEASSCAPIRCGAPQGSILGPTASHFQEGYLAQLKPHCGKCVKFLVAGILQQSL